MKNRSAETLCIGTELLMGDIVNTNAAYLAKELTGLGINLYHQTVVGDNPQRLSESLRLAFSRCDIVLTTGGLGPTYDDISKETVAGFFGRKLVMHEPSLKHLHDFFKSVGRPMTENNQKQALLPEDCVVFENPAGTAPGCAIEGTGELAGKTVILLPGPPNEMRPMFEKSVRPYLLKDSTTHLVSHTMHFFGIGESSLEHMLHDYMLQSQNPTIAPYAKTGEVMLRVTACAAQGEDGEALLAPAMETIRNVAGDYLYGVDVGDLQTAVVQILKQKGLHAATAESCTGGYVSKRITDVPGASQVFECGICCYSNCIKSQILGVSEETLLTHGAVSSQTAREMAVGIRRISGAEIGVSVTGNAGPATCESELQQDNVGLVYIGLDSDNWQDVLTLHLSCRSEDQRESIRYLASSHALHMILNAAKRINPTLLQE